MAEEQYEEDMQKEKVIKQLVLCFFFSIICLFFSLHPSFFFKGNILHV